MFFSVVNILISPRHMDFLDFIKEPLFPVEHHLVDYRTVVEFKYILLLLLLFFFFGGGGEGRDYNSFLSDIFTIFNESSIQAQKIFKRFQSTKKRFIVNRTRQSHCEITQSTKTCRNSFFLEALVSSPCMRRRKVLEYINYVFCMFS